MENTNDFVKIASSIWEQLIHAPAHLLLLVVLMFLGMIIKKSPLPNYWIPWFIVVAGVVTYPFLASPQNVDPSYPNPTFVLHIYGGLLGIGAIIAHVFLRKLKWFAAIERAFVNSFRDDEDRILPPTAGGEDIDPQKP